MSTKLLFADDSVTMQKVIQLTLENEDVSVLIAGDGEDAFRLAESEKPNIIIADVAMPGMDGFKLCEKVKQTPSTSDIPVILISGELEQYDDERGREVGADHHITKPFKSEELINAIKEFAAEASATSGGERGEAEELQGVETEPEQELPHEEESDELVAEAVADNGQEPPMLELTDASAASSEDLSDEPDEELEIIDDDLNDDLDDSPDDEVDEAEELAEVDELDLEGLDEIAGAVKEENVEEENAEEVAVAEQESPPEASAEREEQLFNVEDLPEVAEITDAGIPEIGETAEGSESEESESIEEILKEEIAMRSEPDEFQEKPDVADQILTDVFKGTDDDEPLGDLDGIAQETAQGAVDEVSETPEEAPATDMGIDLGDAVRESVASAVGDFMREEAPAILRDALRESIDSSFKSVLESELENAIKEELGKMIGESLRSIIPEILKMTEKVTTQITPKIAEEMIKIAIEKIKTGDDA